MGCADRSCFDLERHAAATSTELCVKEPLPEPVSKLGGEDESVSWFTLLCNNSVLQCMCVWGERGGLNVSVYVGIDSSSILVSVTFRCCVVLCLRCGC